MNCRWRFQQLNMFLKDMLGLTIFFSRQVPQAFQYGHLALRQEILCVSEQKGDRMILGLLAVTSTLEKGKDERAKGLLGYCSVIKDPLFFTSWSCNHIVMTHWDYCPRTGSHHDLFHLQTKVLAKAKDQFVSMFFSVERNTKALYPNHCFIVTTIK